MAFLIVLLSLAVIVALLYTNGFTEGFSNKIKVLKRNAYGYRNFERFRKRILHMFKYKSGKAKTNAAA